MSSAPPGRRRRPTARAGGLQCERHHGRTGHLHGHRHYRQPQVVVTQTAAVTFAAPWPPRPTPPSPPSARRCPRVATQRSPSRSRTRGRPPNPFASKLDDARPGQRQLDDLARVGRVRHQCPGPGHLHRVRHDGRDRDLLGDRHDRLRSPDRPECQRHVRDSHRFGDRLHRDDDGPDRVERSQWRSAADGNRHRHPARWHQSRRRQERDAERLIVHQRGHHARPANNGKQRPGHLLGERHLRRTVTFNAVDTTDSNLALAGDDPR